MNLEMLPHLKTKEYSESNVGNISKTARERFYNLRPSKKNPRVRSNFTSMNELKKGGKKEIWRNKYHFDT